LELGHDKLSRILIGAVGDVVVDALNQCVSSELTKGDDVVNALEVLGSLELRYRHKAAEQR
jgi:hypothetical protein